MNTKFISLYNLSHYDKNIKNVIDTKVQELNIPYKVSELENDSNFISSDAAQQMIDDSIANLDISGGGGSSGGNNTEVSTKGGTVLFEVSTTSANFSDVTLSQSSSNFTQLDICCCTDVGGATNITYPVTDGNVGWDWLTHLSDSRSYYGVEWMKALRNLSRAKNGDFRTDYFGAMAWLIERILEVNPRIKIIFGNYFSQQYSITLDNMGTFKTKYILEANEQLAKFYGYQCVNPYKYIGLRGETITTLDGNSYEDVTLFCPDGVHPHSDSTGRSNRIIAGVYINALRGIV